MANHVISGCPVNFDIDGVLAQRQQEDLKGDRENMSLHSKHSRKVLWISINEYIRSHGGHACFTLATKENRT